MKLSHAQLLKIRVMTNRMQRYCMPDEIMHYKIKEAYRGSVMLIASNSGSPWYAKHKYAALFIGPRGGIDRKHVNLDGFGRNLLTD